MDLLVMTGLLSSTGLLDRAGLLEVASADSTLHAITTDASAAPTTVAITLGAGQTGLRVFTGETPVNERTFDLYVSRAGGAPYKVQMTRHQGRVLFGAPGDTFALGTSDGRSLQAAALVTPLTLTTSFPVSGTAACDLAGPPIWSPTAAHVTLPTEGSAFSLTADGTERWVFISERKSGGSWTSPRAVKHSATRATRILTSYQEVALANYAGATLGITAPTGSVIGGASVPMSLPIPVATGTTRNVTDVATFKTAIAAAVSGDHIVLAAGAYAMDVAITAASFTANVASGKQGMEGIVIRGATGTASDVVITTDSTLTHGNWDLSEAGTTMSVTAWIKDLTFDFASYSGIVFKAVGGKYGLVNVVAKNGIGDFFVIQGNATRTITFNALNCIVQDSTGDCWNFNGNAATNANSLIRLINCQGLRAGALSSAQCATSHNGMPFQIWGGLYKDAFTNVLANDATTTPAYVFYATLDKGTRQAQVANGINLFGVDWAVGSSGGIGAISCGVYLSKISGALAGSTTNGIFASSYAARNFVNVTVGRGIFWSTGGNAPHGNIIVGANESIRFGNSGGSGAQSTVIGNTVVGGNIGYTMQDVNLPTLLRNNASKTMSTSINVASAGVDATVDGDYNTLDPTVSANYSVGAHDTTGADAQLDSDYFPTVGGNCDGNGDATAYDYVGGTDPWGFVFLYAGTRASRGAREIPAIYTGAALFPDLW